MADADEQVRRARELYDELQFGNFNYGDERKKQHKLLSRALESLSEDGHVYDIGCGAGYWFKVYESFGVKPGNIHAIDLADSNAQNLQALGYDVRQGDARTLPFPDQSGDLTICSGVLHHIPEREKAFNELVRVTKDQGHILISVYHALHPRYFLVHKVTAPFRYLYWNVSKKIEWLLFFPWLLVNQIGSFLFFRKFMDWKTARTIFLDDVMTPVADTFTRKSIQQMVDRAKGDCGCELVLEDFMYRNKYMMISALIQKNPQ